MAAKKKRAEASVTKSSKRFFLLICIPFLFLLLFITRGIQLPYVGYNSWNFNTYSLIARNYNTYGYLHTKFAPITSVAKTLPKSPEYYLHHPQLLSVVLSVFYKTFGYEFWIGRGVVILFSVGSVILMIALANKLFGRVFAVAVAFAASMLPATAVFGRMINMEPLVLFFALCAFNSLFEYLKTKRKRDLLIVISCVVLGTLSDWPMVYIACLLGIICFLKKQTRVGIMCILSAFITESLFLAYVYMHLGTLQELLSAILNRSAGTLVTYAYWPIIWLVTIVLRLAIYFNPLFLIASLIFLFVSVVKVRKMRITDKYILVIIFFAMGILNILPFPDGSFGHAYWIYYFIPFFTFGTAWFMFTLYKRSMAFLILLLVVSYLYTVKIVDWKTKEIAIHEWRYELGKKLTEDIPPYSLVLVNKDSVVDSDLFAYVFLQNVSVQNEVAASLQEEEKYFIYSCLNTCSIDKTQPLKNSYLYKSFSTIQAEAFVFNLHEKRNEINRATQSVQTTLRLSTLPDKSNTLKEIYHHIVSFLHLPQL